MKRIAIAAVLLACAGASEAQPPQKSDAECGADNLGKYMNMWPDEFDQTLGEGWREVGDKEGCERAAADLIARYRDEKLAQDIAGLDWHEAQLRAAAGGHAGRTRSVSAQSGIQEEVFVADRRPCRCALHGGDDRLP